MSNELNWTDKRCEQLVELRKILVLAKRTNSSTDLISHIKKLDQLVDGLSRSSGSECSFLDFLGKLAVADLEKRQT